MSKLSHIDDKGQARMVDVSDKAVTDRRAVAEGFIRMQPETLALVEAGEAKKGDVIGAARAGLIDMTRDARPALAPLGLVPLYLEIMERAHYAPFATVVDAPQWRKQWALWRGA